MILVWLLINIIKQSNCAMCWKLTVEEIIKEAYLGDEIQCKINIAMHILENVAIRDGGKMLYESIFIF